MAMFTKIMTFLFLIALLSTEISAQSPRVSIQGTLKDAKGAAAADGMYTVIFKLYTTPTLGTPLWTETATVNVAGGIYSHYLGSVTPLNNEDFVNLLFLGVQVGNIELSPRTELTYAPYAFAVEQVICSGALGDVKYSILDPIQFTAVNGSCWVPMDGRSIVNSKLLAYLGTPNIPDGSGAFLRIQEFNNINDYDPDRLVAGPIGIIQSSAVKPHNHNVTETPHSHPYDDYTSDDGVAYTYAAASPVGHQAADDGTSDLSGTTGSSFMNASINPTGVAETRPKNLNFWIYVRIN